jgi:hypothetical protein
MAFCSNCGTKLDEGAKFCPSCGTPAAGVQAPAAAAQTPPVAAAPAAVSLSSYDDFSLKMIAKAIQSELLTAKAHVGSPLPVASVIAGINIADGIEGPPVDVGSASVNQIIANLVKAGLCHKWEFLQKKLGITVTKADLAASLDKLEEGADQSGCDKLVDGTVSSVAPGFGSSPAVATSAAPVATSATADSPDILGNMGKAVADQFKQQLKGANPFKGLFGK